MNKKLFLKTKESLSSVLPITTIVLMLNFTISPMPFSIRILFLIGTLLLILGMGLFTLGADIAMMPIGEQIGAQLTKSKKISLLIIGSLIMGIIITMAEPDLQVLANQIPSVPNIIIVLTVAVGVGIFLVVALLRIIFQWKLAYILIGLYTGVFILSVFIPKDYLAVAFDSGGVTTGPITVPFILSLGVGLSSVKGGNSSHDDSFGLVALCSIGPLFAIMLLRLFLNQTATNGHEILTTTDVKNMHDIFQLMKEALPKYSLDIIIALLPIIIFFVIFQIFALKLPKVQMIKISIGLFYTYIGLVLFLTGVNIGFLPAGYFIGHSIGGLSYSWILIPLGMIMGYFVVSAEPAVHVLNDQVEYLTGGAISKKAMLWSLSIGVALSLGLAMIRIIFEISILYFLLPGYTIALILTFFSPKIFTAIAFDSGGVTSGPMTATFILPFAMGACLALGGNMLLDAFGIVAMVAMTPLITIQVMGLVYKIKISHTEKEELYAIEELTDSILDKSEFEWSKTNVSSDVVDTYDWIEDTEFVENYDWAEELKEEMLAEEIAADNSFIDFEKQDQEQEGESKK
ncbi:DUF1538 domain-containing protein [Anaerovorax odorimutans]|uniref:DUF1538 domain-containing protein n=1 Tax=Anaerovorax odorimutans TaxID=109327 RepID=UPI000408DAA1|nr:DUF1538 domain-containing protein [Anaerovorax odorimutans]